MSGKSESRAHEGTTSDAEAVAESSEKSSSELSNIESVLESGTICGDAGFPCEFRALYQCGSCKMVNYCSKECQKEHWMAHGKECKLWTKLSKMSTEQAAVKFLTLLMKEVKKESVPMNPENSLLRLLKFYVLRDGSVPPQIINAADSENGQTALMCACNHSWETLVESLLEAGANVHQKDTDRGSNAFHMAIATPRVSIPILQRLLDAGAELEAKTDTFGVTALAMASWVNTNATIEVMEFLIDKGADINTRMDNGMTPLYMAIKMTHMDQALFLIEKGANVHLAPNHWQTPLAMAKEKGLTAVVERLQQAGAL